MNKRISRAVSSHRTSVLVFLFLGALLLGAAACSLGGSVNSPAGERATAVPQTEAPAAPTAAPLVPPTVTSTSGVGVTRIGKVGETLVYVPEGEFTMGSENGDERPVHTVYLDAFWVDQTEVTNKQYQACVDAGVCQPPSSSGSSTQPDYYGNPEFDAYPVIYVNWDQANTYCEAWAGGDLPTEAQWEKAASWSPLTQEKTIYPWGNDFDGSFGNFCDVNCAMEQGSDKNSDDGYADTAPVGNYPDGVSPYGAYDMAGNVWEWVNDWYGENYYYDSLPSNPLGPDSGRNHIVRGGAWVNNKDGIHTTDRFRNLPDAVADGVGFRCASPLP